jgi:nitroreductase
MNTRTISNEDLLSALRWRYAAKRFNAQKKISEADWRTLEESLVLTPSSFGLQPWKFLVLTDPALRRQLVPVTWDQPQVVDCSHYVVFAILKNVGVPHLDHHLRRVSEVRGTPVEKLELYRNLMVGKLVEGPLSLQINQWASRQAYIALGNFMTCAALMGIDTCPIEGLDVDKYDQILDLPKQGFATVVACAAGYRDAEDKYAKLAKVRFPASELIERR